MGYWTVNVDTEPDLSLIGDRLQAEFDIQSQPVSDEISRLLIRLRSAERLTRIRSGF